MGLSRAVLDTDKYPDPVIKVETGKEIRCPCHKRDKKGVLLKNAYGDYIVCNQQIGKGRIISLEIKCPSCKQKFKIEQL